MSDLIFLPSGGPGPDFSELPWWYFVVWGLTSLAGCVCLVTYGPQNIVEQLLGCAICLLGGGLWPLVLLTGVVWYGVRWFG